MTYFEHLPNEVLLEIFSYCHAEDLFVSLFNLNTRLNTLIYTRPVSIDLHNWRSKCSLDLYYEDILFNARKQIHTLELCNRYGRLSRFLANDNQIPVDFETRTWILSQVKSLILCDTNSVSLNQILQYTSNIEYLRVSMVYRQESTSDYDQESLQLLFAKLSLKQLCLKYYRTVIPGDDIGISTSLTHLTLFYCFIKDLAKLLRRLPNLRKLHVMCTNPPDFFSDDYDPFDYPLYDGLSYCISYLTELKISICHMSFQELELFLRQLPQLTKLIFSSLLMENYSNGHEWERMITNHLPNLQTLSLFINECYFPEDFIIDLHEIIQPFNSFFWHRWPVVIEYFVYTIEKKRFILYTLPMQKRTLPAYLYGLQVRMTIDTHDLDIDKSYSKKVDNLDLIFHDNSSVNNLLPQPTHSNLVTLSFSCETIDPRSFEIQQILSDLQQIFSSSIFHQIKEIYFYDEIYPTDFVSSLLKLFPNVIRLHLPASSLNLSISLPLITSLTIHIYTTTEFDAIYILHRIASHFPNLLSLSLESVHNYDVYSVVSYCLRKFPFLSPFAVTINPSDSCIDQQGFHVWFNDYKQLNGLNDDVQVEFNDDKLSFQITQR